MTWGNKLQDTALTGDTLYMDKATPENLKNLVEVGKKLLEKPVSRINLETGLYEDCNENKTNKEALTRYKHIILVLFCGI